jgi:hypothetical protein
MSGGIVRVEDDDLLELRGGVLKSACLGQKVSHFVDRNLKAGILPGAFLVLSERGLRLLPALVNQSQVKVNVSLAGEGLGDLL